jgi:hypothetical protein
MVESEMPQTTWRMRVACWISKTTHALAAARTQKYVIFVAFPLQQWFRILRVFLTLCKGRITVFLIFTDTFLRWENVESASVKPGCADMKASAVYADVIFTYKPCRHWQAINSCLRRFVIPSGDGIVPTHRMSVKIFISQALSRYEQYWRLNVC